MKTIETKLALGKRWFPVKLVYVADRIFFLAGFSKKLNAEIKMMEGHTYHGYEGAPHRDFVLKTFGRAKLWSAKDTQHNAFQLAYLQGHKPYKRYKQDLLETTMVRDCLMGHQCTAVRFFLTRKQCILAGEMGVGKTLSEIEAREQADPHGCWYVAPRSALDAVDLELKKWNARIRPEMMTDRGLVKRIRELEGMDIVPPQWLTLDESSMYKNPTSQRSQAAYMIACAMREYWGDDCYIVLMTGSPAPKSPLDWWMQCHIARPGYLIEGDYNKLRSRLAVVVERDFGAGAFPHIETWKDREGICDICGKEEGAPEHTPEMAEFCDDEDVSIHDFKPAVNEVAKLHRRMSGLVLFQFKKDCVDLPDKRYDKIHLEPTKKLLQIARTIASTAPSVAEALIRLRTLSDGFLYDQEKTGVETCPICEGKKEMMDWVIKPEFELNLPSWMEGECGFQSEEEWRARHFDRKLIECIRCSGRGEVDTFTRFAKEVQCPKEDALRDLIERHAEVGRLVVYAGFTGSVDRCVRIFEDMKWEIFRWDGRGKHCSIPDVNPLELFQSNDNRNIGFVGQPGAAGMGLTLTASPSCVYWSNTFNAVDRIQSEDRIHRVGMDTVRGATIIDLFHLPTDYLVYQNIEEKRARQDLTMGIDISMAQVLESLND